MVRGQLIGPHCMHYVLSLLTLIFKAYKDLTLFHVFLLYAYVMRVEVEPVEDGYCSFKSMCLMKICVCSALKIVCVFG